MSGSRLEALRKFLEDDPSDTFTRYAIALEYISMNNSTQAVASFEELLKDDPAYVPAYHQLGLLHLRLGRAEEGRAVLSRGVVVARTAGDTHAQLEMQEAIEESEG